MPTTLPAEDPAVVARRQALARAGASSVTGAPPPATTPPPAAAAPAPPLTTPPPASTTPPTNATTPPATAPTTTPPTSTWTLGPPTSSTSGAPAAAAAPAPPPGNYEGADSYYAHAGQNLRGQGGHVVNGVWQGSGDERIDGHTIDEVNTAITEWDQGYRRATGQIWLGVGQPGARWDGWGTAADWVDPSGRMPSGSGQPAGPGVNVADMESETNEFIRRLMSGEEGPYTEKIQAGLRGKVAAEGSTGLLNANRAATLAAARGGTSGTVGSTLAANARGARSDIAEGNQGIDFEASTENAKSKIQGLQAAQDTIQRKYQDAWNKATDATQRDGIQKQYQAAMSKIQADKEAAQSMADAERIQGAAGRAFSLDMFNRQNERDDYTYQRDLPTNTYRNSGLGG